MDRLHTALPVLEKLNQAGYEAYIVGGAVRNFLLDLPINDIDITTSALPDEVESIFDKTIPIGKEHGTVMVVMNDTFEVTTFRIDGEYIDHRRPDEVFFVKNLKEDLIRRDFTVNAMALDEEMHVIDYAGGQHDIALRLIRAVGQAEDRFREDALRMLRAARFQSVLDFDIEEKTALAMKQEAHLIEHVAIERINTEFEKLLKGLNPAAGILSILNSGLYHYLPFFRSCSTLYLPKRALSLEVYIAYHLHLGFGNSDDIRKLKLSNDSGRMIRSASEILDLLKSEPDEEIIKWMIYQYPLDLINECQTLLHSDIDFKVYHDHKKIEKRQDIQINGHLLMNHLNAKPGRWLKMALNDIEKEIVLGRLANNQQDILKWVEQHVKI